MGTDTNGKQEVEPALLARPRLFTDEVAQSVTIGEAQGLITPEAITPIGKVIAGLSPARQSDDDIALFNGTSLGLQDIAVAGVASDELGLAETVEV